MTEILPYRLNQTQAMHFVGYKDTRAFMKWVNRNRVPYIPEGRLKFFLVDTLKRKMKGEEASASAALEGKR